MVASRRVKLVSLGFSDEWPKPIECPISWVSTSATKHGVQKLGHCVDQTSFITTLPAVMAVKVTPLTVRWSAPVEQKPPIANTPLQFDGSVISLRGSSKITRLNAQPAYPGGVGVGKPGGAVGVGGMRPPYESSKLVLGALDQAASASATATIDALTPRPASVVL
jgi:hypothetical protein